MYRRFGKRGEDRAPGRHGTPEGTSCRIASTVIYYITMDISRIVAAARRQAGLTQQQLAERAGTSQPAVARLERGGGSPSLATVRRLVNAAGFDLKVELLPRATRRDPVIAAYQRDVDRTLLRENLRKTVDRRLRDMEAFRKDAEQLRAAVQRAGRGP
jgi:transcriptional regulator with XRE-family HTH domain